MGRWINGRPGIGASCKVHLMTSLRVLFSAADDEGHCDHYRKEQDNGYYYADNTSN